MTNKEKKRHHFVPQVYLRKFAHSKYSKGNKKKHLVSTYDKINDRKESDTSVDKICFKTKLYTLDSSKREKRESIENFYANTIEKDYNRFYEIITNDNIANITLEERELVIMMIINMYLRNLYWFKVFNDFWTTIIMSHDYPEPVNVYNEDGNVLFPFETQAIDEIIATQKKENRDIFIQEHLRLTINLVKSHFNDIIFVDSDKGGNGFITSDRPVLCDTVAGSFRMPIDKDYYLTIMPNIENVPYDSKKIVRNNPMIKARMFNILQFENAERLIIGNSLDDIEISKNNFINAKKRMK